MAAPSTADLARVAQTNLMALNRHLRHAQGTDVLERGAFFRWSTGVPHPYYNGVVCAVPPDAATAQLATEAIDHFRARGVPEFCWWLEPDAADARWPALLEPLGYRRGPEIPALAVALETLAPLDPAVCTVRRVANPDDRATWTLAFVRGFEYPEAWRAGFEAMYRCFDGPDTPLRSYVAFLGDEPVATSTLFLADGVAGVYDVATARAVRGRGIGSQITRAPLLEARALGLTTGVLQSSAMGVPVYERLGFQRVSTLDYFEWKAGAQSERTAIR